MVNDPSSRIPPGGLSPDCGTGPEVDALDSLRCDAPPIWDLLRRGQVDAAISAGNRWLSSESHLTRRSTSTSRKQPGARAPSTRDDLARAAAAGFALVAGRPSDPRDSFT